MESGLTNHQLSEELDQQRGSRHPQQPAFHQTTEPLEQLPRRWQLKPTYHSMSYVDGDEIINAGGENNFRDARNDTLDFDILTNGQMLGTLTPKEDAFTILLAGPGHIWDRVYATVNFVDVS